MRQHVNGDLMRGSAHFLTSKACFSYVLVPFNTKVPNAMMSGWFESRQSQHWGTGKWKCSDLGNF